MIFQQTHIYFQIDKLLSSSNFLIFFFLFLFFFYLFQNFMKHGVFV